MGERVSGLDNLTCDDRKRKEHSDKGDSGEGPGGRDEHQRADQRGLSLAEFFKRPEVRTEARRITVALLMRWLRMRSVMQVLVHAGRAPMGGADGMNAASGLRHDSSSWLPVSAFLPGRSVSLCGIRTLAVTRKNNPSPLSDSSADEGRAVRSSLLARRPLRDVHIIRVAWTMSTPFSPKPQAASGLAGGAMRPFVGMSLSPRLCRGALGDCSPSWRGSTPADRIGRKLEGLQYDSPGQLPRWGVDEKGRQP